jgi:MATE family multidrug resistance protein
VLVPTLTHVFSYVGVMLPLGWALAHPAHLGVNGIVLAALIASIIAAGLLLGRFWLLARQEL